MWSETKFNSFFGMSYSFVNEGIGDKTCRLMNKNAIQKYTPDRYKSEKHITMQLVQLNQVLAPFVIRDKEMRQSKDINPNNLKTFKFYGKAVLVGFVPVFIEDFDNVIKIFNMDVNEYLNRYTKVSDLSQMRCWIKCLITKKVGFRSYWSRLSRRLL